MLKVLEVDSVDICRSNVTGFVCSRIESVGERFENFNKRQISIKSELLEQPTVNGPKK